MLNLLLFLAVVVLGAVAFQLSGIKHQFAADARRRDASDEQRLLDELIREQCPNLFHAYRRELRSWFALHERRATHYEERKDFVTEDPHSDEEVHVYDIIRRLSRDAAPEQRALVGELSTVIENFEKGAAVSTGLKPAEIAFLAFQELADAVPEGDGHILRVSVEGAKAALARHLKTYETRTPATS